MDAFFVSASFAGLVGLANLGFRLKRIKGRSGYEAFGGIAFLLAISGPPAYALWKAASGSLWLPMWPRSWPEAIALLALFFLVSRNEMLVDIVKEGRPLGSSVSTFFGAVGVHFASMLSTIGVLYPVLKAALPLPLAIIAAAASFSVYHLCQFEVFPEGVKPAYQFRLFAFSLGYVLVYQLSGSFFIAYALQHLVASATFIHDKDYDFGERDAPFYFGIAVVAAALIVSALWLS